MLVAVRAGAPIVGLIGMTIGNRGRRRLGIRRAAGVGKAGLGVAAVVETTRIAVFTLVRVRFEMG